MLHFPFIETATAVCRWQSRAILCLHKLDVICAHSVAFNELLFLLVPIQLAFFTLSRTLVAGDVERGSPSLLGERRCTIRQRVTGEVPVKRNFIMSKLTYPFSVKASF